MRNLHSRRDDKNSGRGRFGSRGGYFHHHGYDPWGLRGVWGGSDYHGLNIRNNLAVDNGYHAGGLCRGGRGRAARLGGTGYGWGDGGRSAGGPGGYGLPRGIDRRYGGGACTGRHWRFGPGEKIGRNAA